MEWQPIDFYGIIALDQRVVQLLRQYLEERESRIALFVIQILGKTESLDDSKVLRLSESIEEFSKQARTIEKTFIDPHQKEKTLSKLNQHLWEFTEILESSVVELFQQINQLNVDQWHPLILEVVKEIIELIHQKIEEFTWAMRRIEGPLNTYLGKHHSPSNWKNWLKKNSKLGIDPEIQTHLAQCEQLLHLEYSSFYERYQEYVGIITKTESLQKKMRDFALISLLEESERTLYLDVFRLLKIWEFTPKSSSYLKTSITHALRSITNNRAIFQTYKHHYENIKEALFRGSLENKAEQLTSEEKSNLPSPLQEAVLDRTLWFQEELKAFISMLTGHREFILDTDPNPYVKSRLGFAERPVGIEPQKAKDLTALIFKAEELNDWYNSFIHSNQSPLTSSSLEDVSLETKILLHEMSQPLISRSLMRQTSQRFLSSLSKSDELGSRDPQVIDFIEESLNLAMRADWKYHVLHENPSFHQIFQIHSALTKNREDITHHSRMMHFKHLCHQIEEWLRKGNLEDHSHEIELDMNDMKIYLQNFFATAQKIVKDPIPNQILDPLLERLQHQLLDYRYLFGQFFYNLTQKEEGVLLRNQFLFVDQYFESIENVWKDFLGIRKHVKDT